MEFNLDIFFFSWTTVGWLIAYVYAIYIGFKQKTYAVPFIALALNFTWEIAASIFYKELNFYSFTYRIWALVDVLILVTYLLYGYNEFRMIVNNCQRRWWILWSILCVVLAALWQIICRYTLHNWLVVTSFNINILMSILIYIYAMDKKREQRTKSCYCDK